MDDPGPASLAIATSFGADDCDPQRSVSRDDLRRAGIKARRSIKDHVRQSAEARLWAHLGHVDLSPATIVGVTIADDGEPDLEPWARDWRSRGGQVALPTLLDDPDDFSMRFRLWRDGDRLSPGRYGIPCPPAEAGREVLPTVVLVPVVRFDGTGNRLGRGAGFYDRWLGEHQPRTFGVAFEAQRVAELDPQPHDVRLEAMVTDLGIRWFGPMGEQ